MKILSITNLCHGYTASLPERNLYKGLASRGMDLVVVTHYPTPESAELEAVGIKIRYIRISKKIDPEVIRQLRKIIMEEKTDILHFTFGKALTNGLIASWGLHCKTVAYLGSISLHWYDPTAWISYLNTRIDKLICLSDGVQKHLKKQAPFLLRKKTVRIYKGYETSWFSNVKPVSRELLDIPVDAFIVSCVAKVRKPKAIPRFIRSADCLPAGLPVYFVLTGPGMDSPEIKELIGKSSYRNNFRTAGFTNDVLSYIAACDLYVQPSLSEGLGRSVMEAMCLGKPVVVSGKGGVRELVDQGINGFFVQEATESTIASAIMHCYENRLLLPPMGLKSKEKIEKEFNSERMIDSTFSLFRSFMPEKHNI